MLSTGWIMNYYTSMKTLRYWAAGIRLYIALAGIVLAAEIWWWSYAVYGSSTQGVIRMQEIYAWTAVGLLVSALSIGPLLKIAPHLPGKQLLRDARRMLGVMAAAFAVLHAMINYVGLFGAANPLQLAPAYQRSFLLGAGALVILLLMAATSFDAAFRMMGIWWFRLHRLIYGAGLMVLMHAFMIGSHASSLLTFSTLAVATILLLGVHSFFVVRQERPPYVQVISVTLSVVFAVAILNYGLTKYLGYNILLDLHNTEQHDH